MDKYTAELNKAVGSNLGRVLEADGTQALRLRCVAYPQSGPHYADAVLVSATSLTLSIDGVADSTVGSSGVLAFATYTTLGALVDAINVSANWEAEIVAGLRTDAVNGSELLARSTSTFRMYEEIAIYQDSSDSGVYRLAFCIEANQPFAKTRGQENNDHRAVFKRCLSLVNTSGGEATTITLYEVKKDHASSLRTLASWAGTDNTEKDTGEDSAPIAGNYGNDLLLILTSTGWVDSGAYLKVIAGVE